MSLRTRLSCSSPAAWLSGDPRPGRCPRRDAFVTADETAHRPRRAVPREFAREGEEVVRRLSDCRERSAPRVAIDDEPRVGFRGVCQRAALPPPRTASTSSISSDAGRSRPRRYGSRRHPAWSDGPRARGRFRQPELQGGTALASSPRTVRRRPAFERVFARCPSARCAFWFTEPRARLRGRPSVDVGAVREPTALTLIARVRPSGARPSRPSRSDGPSGSSCAA
jgi:hypothetical protein